jgi:hypothetical protein
VNHQTMQNLKEKIISAVNIIHDQKREQSLSNVLTLPSDVSPMKLYTILTQQKKGEISLTDTIIEVAANIIPYLCDDSESSLYWLNLHLHVSGKSALCKVFNSNMQDYKIKRKYVSDYMCNVNKCAYDDGLISNDCRYHQTTLQGLIDGSKNKVFVDVMFANAKNLAYYLSYLLLNDKEVTLVGELLEILAKRDPTNNHLRKVVSCDLFSNFNESKYTPIIRACTIYLKKNLKLYPYDFLDGTSDAHRAYNEELAKLTNRPPPPPQERIYMTIRQCHTTIENIRDFDSFNHAYLLESLVVRCIASKQYENVSIQEKIDYIKNFPVYEPLKQVLQHSAIYEYSNKLAAHLRGVTGSDYLKQLFADLNVIITHVKNERINRKRAFSHINNDPIKIKTELE